MTRSILFAFASLLVLEACSPAATAPASDTSVVATEAVTLTGAKVAPGRGRHVYQLSWSSDVPNVPVRLEASADPAFEAGTGIVIAEALTATEYIWTAPQDAPRQYFLIIPEAGEPVRVSHFLLPLEGGRNFRDLGGYATGDGRRVKWGTVYRSGVMDSLTDADYDYLSGLGISVICDFRASRERADEPTNWRAGEIEYITFDDPSAEDDMSSAFASVLTAQGVTGEQVRDTFISAYRSMPNTYAPAYTEMFDQLANGSLPLAFNCSAGKDRTGVAAALLLSALGVPRETVVEDYALSEQVVDFMAEFEVGLGEVDPDSPYAFLAQLPPDVIRPLMRTEPAYIEAALDTIEAEHGSVVAFIQSELGVDDDELARIRERLLEG